MVRQAETPSDAGRSLGLPINQILPLGPMSPRFASDKTMLTEHKRVKIGAQPGDINMGCKIALREGRVPLVVFPWQVLDERDASALRRYMKGKSKAVQRRRDRRACSDLLG